MRDVICGPFIPDMKLIRIFLQQWLLASFLIFCYAGCKRKANITSSDQPKGGIIMLSNSRKAQNQNTVNHVAQFYQAILQHNLPQAAILLWLLLYLRMQAQGVFADVHIVTADLMGELGISRGRMIQPLSQLRRLNNTRTLTLMKQQMLKRRSSYESRKGVFGPLAENRLCDPVSMAEWTDGHRGFV